MAPLSSWMSLDESIEASLDKLFTGNYQPGFMVLSSQNPSYFEGRTNVPVSLQDRSHRYYFEPYSHKALADMARNAHIPEPESFATAYEKAQINPKGEYASSKTGNSRYLCTNPPEIRFCSKRRPE
jgi:hypothetical protein